MGGLQALRRLHLQRNPVSDNGIASLAQVCAAGALPSLESLFVNDGHDDEPQLKAMCHDRGIALEAHGTCATAPEGSSF